MDCESRCRERFGSRIAKVPDIASPACHYLALNAAPDFYFPRPLYSVPHVCRDLPPSGLSPRCRRAVAPPGPDREDQASAPGGHLVWVPPGVTDRRARGFVVGCGADRVARPADNARTSRA